MQLQVKGLSKKYYSGFLENKVTKAVDEVSFDIKEGEIFGLVGGSGSGKTTVSKIVMGLLKPSSGGVFYNGRDLTKMSNRDWHLLRKEIQMVFQHPQLTFNPRRNIYFACAEPIRLYKLAKNKIEEKAMVEYLIERVGLTKDQLKKYPHELSGGQAQRLSITRALCLQPKFIICDEPTSMLDVSVQAQILELLKEIHDEFNITMLYISHDLEVIQSICDRVAVMETGKIVEIGSTKDVFNHPQHPYTKQLLGAALYI